MQDEPIDPFSEDPSHSDAEFTDESDAVKHRLTPAERQDVLDDLADMEIYQALLAPTGIRGLVIDCDDCREPHYFDWDLLRGNLQHLLSSERARVHEPAYDPDPDHYVTWEYARGYADGVHDALAEAAGESRDGGAG
ncbi:MAG: DUF5319 domain-containing protein [Micromonosporaceae bacterium]